MILFNRKGREGLEEILELISQHTSSGLRTLRSPWLICQNLKNWRIA